MPEFPSSDDEAASPAAAHLPLRNAMQLDPAPVIVSLESDHYMPVSAAASSAAQPVTRRNVIQLRPGPNDVVPSSDSDDFMPVSAGGAAQPVTCRNNTKFGPSQRDILFGAFPVHPLPVRGDRIEVEVRCEDAACSTSQCWSCSMRQIPMNRARVQLGRQLQQSLFASPSASTPTHPVCKAASAKVKRARPPRGSPQISPSRTHEGGASDDDAPICQPIAILAPGLVLQSQDFEIAKEELRQLIQSRHGGRIRVQNSNSAYIYMECKDCSLKCAAALKTSRHEHAGHWVVNPFKKGNPNSPCPGPAAVCDVPVGQQVSFSVSFWQCIHCNLTRAHRWIQALQAQALLPDLLLNRAKRYASVHCVHCTRLIRVQCVSCFEPNVEHGCSCSSILDPHFHCNACFNTMVATRVTGTDKLVFLDNACAIKCDVCNMPFDMRMCAPHLTVDTYNAYLQTMAEHEVIRNQVTVSQPQAQDGASRIVIMIEEFLQINGFHCPNCPKPFSYDGACAAMICTSCDCHFCLWCRVPQAGWKDDRNQADKDLHNHIFVCQRRPPIEEILTETPLWPTDKGDDPSFVHALFQVRNLRRLRLHMRTAWNEEDCCQAFNCFILRDIVKECVLMRDRLRRTKPHKPRVLRVPFCRILATKTFTV